MESYYEQVLAEAVKALPAKVEERKAFVANESMLGDMPIRLTMGEVRSAAAKSLRGTMPADDAGLLRLAAHVPHVLGTMVDGSERHRLSDLLTDALVEMMLYDMEGPIQEAHREPFEGLTVADLSDGGNEALEAAGRLSARRVGIDTSPFRASLERLEGEVDLHVLFAFSRESLELARKLHVYGECAAARRLLELNDYVGENRGRFLSSSSPRP